MVLMPEEEQKGEEGKKTFKEIGVCDELCAACQELEWEVPTRIQVEAIPPALKGKDIIGIAQTGSGKTGAFALPVIQKLLEKKAKTFNICLAMSPTRELSIQIRNVFASMGQQIGLKVVSLVGGINMTQQAIELSKRPHIITGTPGRVKDHLESTKGFNLRKLEFLILDEADQMLAMDYEKELTAILELIPRTRQTFLFSATMTQKVDKLQKASLRDPIKIECAAKYSTVEELLQQYVFVPFSERTAYLHYILSHVASTSVIVFCDASHVVQKVALALRLLGHKALPLYGKLDQSYRLASLGKFKEGKARVLVCTDVAARGLDIPSIDVVINYALPLSTKQYIHRVGRTARAGASGRAINIVTQYDVVQVQKIEAQLGKKLVELPVDEEKVAASMPRVEQAERQANSEVKEQERDQRGSSKRKAGDDDGNHQSESYSLQKRRSQNEKSHNFNIKSARTSHRKQKR
eukprot:TRINITY_DN16109_c0_g1_i1.p1 TRINITY_DN16109_c0_g1~~TRINITY_DN16109_c0_g1_i1.p1  ORF type:complete len:465 (+),score=103.00 TRINITY_DN16109_c0_g1_i1:46-1440(+)